MKSAETEPRLIPLDQIRLDKKTQPRESIDAETVTRYAEALARGEQFPAAVLYDDGASKWLADGYLRYYAHSRLKRKEMLCEIRVGTREDAVWFSVSANRNHGLPLTPQDRRRAVMTALAHENGKDLTDEQIGDIIGINSRTVSKYRYQLEKSGLVEKRARRGRKRKSDWIPPETAEAETDDTPKEPGPVPVDGRGNEVPERIAPAFSRAGEFDTLLDSIAKLTRDCKNLAGDQTLGFHLHAQTMTADLNNVKRHVEYAKPYAACKSCTGTGCSQCKGSGWVGKPRAKTQEVA